MNVKMQYSDMPEGLTHSKWDYSFFGKAVDDRGEKALEYIFGNSNNNVSFIYDAENFIVCLDEIPVYVDDLKEAECLNSVFSSDTVKSIVLDSTTLGFADILILLETLRYLQKKETYSFNIDILYAEPIKYRSKNTESELLLSRDFELSESTKGYVGIPLRPFRVDDSVAQKCVFLCGFESERIERAIDEFSIDVKNCICIFGVPAYSPGFEMNSFDSSIKVIKDRSIKGAINYCGASNPLAIMHILDDIFRSLKDNEELFIVPLSTKPMSVGTCLFLLDKSPEKVGILYDHPNDIRGRGIEIAKWHLFTVDLN